MGVADCADVYCRMRVYECKYFLEIIFLFLRKPLLGFYSVELNTGEISLLRRDLSSVQFVKLILQGGSSSFFFIQRKPHFPEIA